MDESLVYEILSVVAEIPEGRVATYGQIARLIGREKNARLDRQSAQHGAVLWKLSMPQSGQPCRPLGAWVAGTAGAAALRGRPVER